MFKFLKRNKGRNRELDEIIRKIQMNMENNYKDAAQLNLKEYERLLGAAEESGKLSESQRMYYRETLADFQGRMRNFTHKDQKPTWV